MVVYSKSKKRVIVITQHSSIPERSQTANWRNEEKYILFVREAQQLYQWTLKNLEQYIYARKIKETIHSIKDKNHINSISYNLPEIWIPNLNLNQEN